MRRLITTDSHMSVPFEVADELPAHYKEQVPHLEYRKDGVYMVRPGMAKAMASMGMAPKKAAGDKKPDAATSAMAAMMAPEVKIDLDNPSAYWRMLQGNCRPEANPSPYPEGRLAEMDREGIVGSVMISNGGFFGGGGDDIDVTLTHMRLCNDWLADTYKPYYDRFAPGASIPTHSVDAAVQELERAAGLGLRPVQLPDIIWRPPYYSAEWEPLWEAAESLGMPLSLHATGNQQSFEPYRPRNMRDLSGELPSANNVAFAMTGAGVAESVGWFVTSGVLERHPGLTLVFTEVFSGWLGWAMDYYDRLFHTGQAKELGVELQELPSHYIRRQIRTTFMWDRAAIEARHQIGLESLMWGSDYPHVEGSFPFAQDWVERQFEGVPEDEVDQIVRRNAAEVFSLTG